MDKQKKKQTKRYITWICLVLVVALLSVMPLLANEKAEAEGPQASILNATLQQRTIDTQIIGGGQLASEGTEKITIPEAVKLTKYLVGNGDTVKEGDAIARVDKVSVMLAMADVQETLDYLSGKIASASTEKDSTKLSAQAAGTVKVIYGKTGDSVRDVMLEHGALAVLSLDDKMAVKITRGTDLTYGTTVAVTLANGEEVEGFVESNIDGVLIVTIEDKDYEIGQSVSVDTEDGKRLGSGELYIHSPWNAAAYYGTIQKVNIKVGDKLSAGKQMFQLEVGNHSANFQILANERQEYEELMQELFEMYSTGVLSAPCDGFVTGVDKDGAFLLAAETGEQSWYVQTLSHTTGEPGWTVTLLSRWHPGGSNNDDPSEPPEATEETPPPETTEPSDPTDPSEPVQTVIYYEVSEVGTGSVTLKKLNSSETTTYAGITYTDGTAIAKGDIVILDENGMIQKYSSSAGSQTPGTGDLSGMMGGMMGGFGGFGGGGGGTAAAFEPYSLETVTVASVTSQEKMTLEIAVDEQDIAKLFIGQDATVTVEALTGQTFPGVITSISNTGTNEGGSSKFTAKVTLSMSGDMLPGMNASAYLPLQSQSVTAIPVAALVENGAETLVYTGYDEKKELLTNPVTVTTGVSDGEYVEILSGLSDTDTVYYAYYDTLEYSRIPDLGLGF